MSRAAIGPAAVLALLAGFAIAGASVELLTHDVSYYLYVSREVLAGALPYTDYIDLESFVDYFIINELTRNVDGYRLSAFMYKDRDSRSCRVV